jgi:hypothetical protein
MAAPLLSIDTNTPVAMTAAAVRPSVTIVERTDRSLIHSDRMTRGRVTLWADPSSAGGDPARETEGVMVVLIVRSPFRACCSWNR